MSSFTFSNENLAKIKKILAKYPANQKRSAVLPLLDLAQRQNNNWLNKEAIEEVARILDMAAIRVWEVASFYTMFNLQPVGKYHIQVCTTVPCCLVGADEILKTCEKTLNVTKKQTTKDGLFTVTEVECLGACIDGPVVQVNDDYHEKMDERKIIDLINKLQGV